MSLAIGIAGLPNVGKSTLFNALTSNDVLASNYPFATIEANVGVVGVPDERLGVLAKMFGSDAITPATVRFVDIAGLVRGASEGAGLGNQFLAHVREADAICQVVRVFEDPDVSHVDGDIDAARDIETVNTELILADLQTLDRALPRLTKEARFGHGRDVQREKAAVVAAAERAHEALDSGKPLHASEGIDLDLLWELHLLTAKPFLYVFNVDQNELGDEALTRSLSELVAPAPAVFLDAQIEAELLELPPEDVRELLHEMGREESGLVRLVRVGFATLGLQTFLTANANEAHAWTIHRGTTAYEAAGVVHSDFQRGFVRADVVSFDELVDAGSMAAARSLGRVRGEGRDYVMHEGDVVEFRSAGSRPA